MKSNNNIFCGKFDNYINFNQNHMLNDKIRIVLNNINIFNIQITE